MDLLIIGQNPSKRNKDNELPFVGTQSHKVLLEWIKYFEVEGEVYLMNYSDKPGVVKFTAQTLDDFGPRLLEKMIEYEYLEIPYKIITLGKIAHEALSALSVNHFALPHPSGRNRLLNDKNYALRLLNECYAFLKEGAESDEESYLIQTANERDSKLV